MATPPNLTQIAFAGGIDESVVDEVLDPSASFRVLQNGRQNRQGGYDKRLGTSPLSRSRIDGSTRTAGRRLVTLRGAPAVIDGAFLDTYLEVPAQSALRSRVPECSSRLLTAPVASVGDGVTDTEVAGGYIAIGYANGRFSVIDAASGAVVSTVRAISVGTPGFVLIGSVSDRYFIAFVVNTNAGTINNFLFDTQSIAADWVATGGATGGKLAAICSLGDRVAIVATDLTTTAISLKTYDQTGLVASATVTATAVPAFIDVSGSTAANKLWLVYATASNGYAQARSVTTPATTVSTQSTIFTGITNVAQSVGVCIDPSGNARTYIYDGLLPTTFRMTTLTTSAGATVAGTVTTIGGVAPCGKAFYQDGRHYLPVYASPTNSTVIAGNAQGLLTMVDWTDDVAGLRPVAHVEPGIVTLPNVTAVPGVTTKAASNALGTKRYFGFNTITASNGGDGAVAATSAKVVELDFRSRSRWQVAEIARSAIMSGALTSVFDGDAVTELGFLAAPPIPNLSLSGTGLTGTFRYVAIYEDIDASGNVVRSGVSAPTGASAPANQTVNVKVTCLSVSARARRPGLRVTLYRTANGGNPPYYRVASKLNDASLPQVTFTDNNPDTYVTAQPKLYAPSLPGTTGESLDRRAPPGLVDIVQYNGMLVGVKSESVVYSGQPVYGEATWFNPVFEIPVPGGGDFVGLEVLDNVVYLFKSTRIFVVAGTPPTDSGSSLGLGDVTALATDVGCIDVNSIVTTSAGIFFQSSRGIELLNRSGQVTFVGYKVSRTLAAYPIVMSARLDARNSVVRFALASAVVNGAATGAGVDVVYDLKLGLWVSTDDKTGQVAHEASQDAAIVTIGGVDRYAWLGIDGFVYVERLVSDASAYLDGTSYVTRIAETANFRLSGIQGTQQVNSVLFLERRATDHDASVALAYNYEASFRTPQTWTAAAIGTLLSTGWPVTQLKHQPHDDAQCQGIRVRVVDAAPTSPGVVGNGQGSTWLALSLDITPKPGVFDVPDLAT